MQSLRSLGLKHIVMLTGDNEKTADGIAEQLKITDYRAELLPDDKVALVQEMKTRGERVAFVGDGVNDAPAMAAATVGIVMGAAGTDVALETADIALMADDLSRIPFTIRLSRQTLGIIKQNIWFSIAVKLIFMALAVVGWATLWMAVAADMGASLAVIANGLRTLRVEDRVD
jgi:Cd2+/Zn2+-exporting ATPase